MYKWVKSDFFKSIGYEEYWEITNENGYGWVEIPAYGTVSLYVYRDNSEKYCWNVQFNGDLFHRYFFPIKDNNGISDELNDAKKQSIEYAKQQVNEWLKNYKKDIDMLDQMIANNVFLEVCN